ncbi:intein/intein [Couchioplanes caeruleus]|uniref:Intein/intein n=3 Tax=Couchioplanes caeruleus TaxID=56438 RepID=A0A3N1GD58_9ACTN|nr:intein/intein [Couchioplanes caeruleus]
MLRQEPRTFAVPAVGRAGWRSRRLTTLTLACVLALLVPFIAVPPASAAGVVTVTNPYGQAAPTGVAYSKAMTATGGTTPYAWSALSLPPGLAIDATTGLISGTPTIAGTYATKVTATDTTGVAGTVSFSFATGVIVTYPSSRGSNTGTPIAPLALKVAGGTGEYTWTATGLPTGLAIDAATGVITGTPTADGAYTVKATATDTAGKAGSTGFTWTVAPGATITDPGPVHATTGVAASKQMIATGGTTPHTWTATGLPAGLTIKASTGLISGTATAATDGTASVLITVTDAAKIATTITVPVTVATPVSITDPGTRSDATGNPVSATLAAAGGVAPYTWSAAGLPAGLALDRVTGVVSGTPTTVGSSPVSVTATDAGQRTHTTTFTWNIVAPITIGNPGGQVGPTGVAYAKTLTASGGTTPYRWSATGLPAGLSIDAATGVISGTPTTAGSQTTKVTVTDKNGITGSVSFSFATGVIVTYPSSRGSGIGMPITPLAIKAAGGTGDYTWTATGLPPGLSIDPASGVITGTPTTNGVYTAKVTATDAARVSGATSFPWTIAAAPELTNPGTVHATTGIALSHQMTATGGKAPYTWSATGLPAGLTIKASTGLITGTVTTPATASVTVTVTDALKITNTVTFALTVGTPIAVTSPGTRASTAGAAITNVVLNADGGTAPYTWIVNGLPAGLSATVAGVVSGVPTGATTSVVTATVIDGAGRTATTSFTWNVAGPLAVADPGAQAGTIGVATTLELVATGGSGDLRWAATGLPTGMSLNAATGEISGTPTTEGTWTVAVTVTDANDGTASIEFAWNAATAVAAVNPGDQTTLVGQPVNLTLVAGGGATPYTWTVDGLPAGLALDPRTGIVTGAPGDASAGATVTATITDAAGRTDHIAFTWVVELLTPIALTAHAEGLQTVQLEWASVEGAAGYGIYRDGARVATTGTDTTLWDRQLDGATTYQYRVTAISGEGVETATSTQTAATTLPTPAAPENYTTCPDSDTHSCAYTASTPADATHPDAGRGLTDGVHGDLNAAGVAWQGRPATDKYTFTVDLGTSRPITEINSTWLQKQNQDVELPVTVAYAFSNDGQNFTDLTLVSRPYVSDADQVKAYRAVGLNDTARYVRATVNGSAGWSLIDEIEIRGVIAGIPAALTLSEPKPAPVDQGQQVPALAMTVDEPVGPFAWTADGLPEGLTIDRTTGVITGTVRAAGTFTVTVTATSGSGRTGHTIFPWLVYAGPATGPVMSSGMVAGFGSDVSSGGVAVLGGYAYTAMGYKVVRYDLAAGKDATAQTVAGNGSNLCVDASSGAQARIWSSTARVIGTDGSLIYVYDYSCGLRAVNPATGATRTIKATVNTTTAIAGRYLYTHDGSSSKIWRYDLQSGQSTVVVGVFNMASGGVLAADNTHLWVFRNDDDRLYRLDLNNTSATAQTFALPSTEAFTAARSAGDYIYYTDSRNLLTRISKSDGSTQIVAGDGAHDDELLYNTTAIATDGTYLYTAGDHGLAKLTVKTRTYAPPATGPVMSSGMVAGFGSDVSSGGVAVLGGYAYTAMGYKVVRYDLAAGKDATAQTVAGNGSNLCVDASSGAQARIWSSTARVIGTDGSLIYVYDYSCGLRAVNPATGATRTIKATVNTTTAIAGRYLYTHDGSSSKIWRYDLQSGQSTVVVGVFNMASGGVLAADNTHLWVFRNDDDRLYRLDLNNTSATAQTFALPSTEAFTAARSAGDYIYYTDSRNLLTRISKSDGSTQIVAGDGAHDDELLYNTTAIATDGTYLYTAGDHGLAKLTVKTRTYAPPATGPVMSSGMVAGFGSDVSSGGVAVLGGYAYTAMGYKVVRYDLAAGKDATAQTVAGNGSNLCVDASSGAQARIWSSTARVIGTDGSLIYVYDYSCGLRAVNPATGATRTIKATVNTTTAIAGRYLYTHDYDKIWRYDLQSGQSAVVVKPFYMSGVLAADNTYVWAFNNNDYKLWRLDPTGGVEPKTFPLPDNGVTAARSAGDYIYYTDSRNLLTRISKSDGSTQIVAGDGAHDDELLYNTTAIATDGTYLYTAGDHGLAKLATVSRVYEEPAVRAPVNFGDVRPLGPDVQTNGVAVLGGYAYTAMGYKVVRYDLAAGKDATAQTVAGNGSNLCVDASSGAQARIWSSTARVIGTDGSLIYVYDYSCGLRAVNPATGATRTIKATVNTTTAIAGRYLYTHDYDKIWRYDLQSGQSAVVVKPFYMSGVLAADNTYVWAFNNNDYKLWRLDPTGGVEPKTFPLPDNGVTAARSAGDYIYYTDSRNLLTRISKSDGSTQIVAGDGAHDDELLYNTTAIATDGTYLYTAGDHGLAKLATVSRVYEEPAVRAPVNFGDVRPLGPDVQTNGVAVLGGYAYTAMGYKVVRYDLAAGKDATAQTVAGNGSNLCVDASSGAQARIWSSTARVIGTDGSLIYVYDYSCGLRAVNPATGATRTIKATVNTTTAIAGRYLYTHDYDKIWRYDLQSGQSAVVVKPFYMSGVLAADNTYVWAFNNNDYKLWRLDPTGGVEPKTFPLPDNGVTAARSAGDYIYYTDSSDLLTRISKSDGSLQVVAGEGAHDDELLYNTTAIATDGTQVYTAGAHGIAKLAAKIRTFAPPATGPVMDSGRVTRFGPDRWAKGVTVLNGYAYTAVGYRIVRFDLATGAGEQVVAGNESYGCTDAGSGGLASFRYPNVIGNDGKLIYVADSSCGLREVNPNTGSTRKINARANPHSVIAGPNLYTLDSAGKIWRYNLSTRQPTPLFTDMTVMGTLAADSSFVWAFNNNDGMLHRLDPSGKTETKTFPIPEKSAYTALSAGNYIYYTDSSNVLRRISKIDGSLRIIAGDGAHDDDLLFSVMDIASDNGRLYVADEHGLHRITVANRNYAPTPPLGPAENSGNLTRIDVMHGDRWGITVLRGMAYTAERSKITWTNIFHPADTGTVAGGDDSGCMDGNSGALSSFSRASIVGNDGVLIYVADDVCGLRAVNPDTGSTRTLRAPANMRSVIARKYLYTLDSSGTLYQYGLESGVTNVVGRDIAISSLLTADSSAAWLINGRTLTKLSLSDTDGKLSTTPIGTPDTITTGLAYQVMGAHIASAGNLIYAMVDVPPLADGTLQKPRIARIHKNDYGFTETLSSPWDGAMTGLAVTYNDVYTLDSQNGYTNIVSLHFPTSPDESYYIEPGTAFVPSGNRSDVDYLSFNHTVIWDPATRLCVDHCTGIRALATAKAWDTWDFCLFDDLQGPESQCDVNAQESFLVEKFVNDQQIYNLNGTLKLEAKVDTFNKSCATLAIFTGACQERDAIQKAVETAETLLDVASTIKDFLDIRGGLRPNNTSCNSFRADTRVLMADGDTVPIKDIRPGQQVLAADPVSQETAAQPVTAVHVNTDTELTDLTLADGSVVHTTAHHPFWTPAEQRWTDAQDLVAGTILSSTDGVSTTVQSVHNFTGSMTMYNLTVDRLHTYYVMAANTPVLVHNTDCDHIALGLEDVDGESALAVFAMEREALTHREWPGNEMWYDKLKSYLSSGSNKRISFNLDGIVDPVASARAGAGVDPSMYENLTNWELHQVSQSPDAWSRITFYRGGRVVPNPFE